LRQHDGERGRQHPGGFGQAHMRGLVTHRSKSLLLDFGGD
jgi:hypothetical protein